MDSKKSLFLGGAALITLGYKIYSTIKSYRVTKSLDAIPEGKSRILEVENYQGEEAKKCVTHYPQFDYDYMKTDKVKYMFDPTFKLNYIEPKGLPSFLFNWKYQNSTRYCVLDIVSNYQTSLKGKSLFFYGTKVDGKLQYTCVSDSKENISYKLNESKYTYAFISSICGTAMIVVSLI
jgi:hypothetical protein